MLFSDEGYTDEEILSPVTHGGGDQRVVISARSVREREGVCPNISSARATILKIGRAEIAYRMRPIMSGTQAPSGIFLTAAPQNRPGKEDR